MDIEKNIENFIKQYCIIHHKNGPFNWYVKDSNKCLRKVLLDHNLKFYYETKQVYSKFYFKFYIYYSCYHIKVIWLDDLSDRSRIASKKPDKLFFQKQTGIDLLTGNYHNIYCYKKLYNNVN